MTEYFVRNITSVCLPESICRIFALSLLYPVQRTFCHSEELRCNDVRIPRKGHHIMKPTQDTFVLAWRKRNKQAKDKQLTFTAIVWSKVQCAPWGKTIPPQLRWYCLLMCFRIKELWIVINVNFVARGISALSAVRPHADCRYRFGHRKACKKVFVRIQTIRAVGCEFGR